MPIRREKHYNEEIYHLVIRRLEGKLLFKDTNDYFRGIFSIYEFNNSKPVEISRKREESRAAQRMSPALRRGGVRDSGSDGRSLRSPALRQPGQAGLGGVRDSRDKLLEMLCFAFMPNHIHMMARQLQEGGIVKFMNKLGSGYSRYFKEKYRNEEKYNGYFFQGRFKSVRVKSEIQLQNLFVYIHTNALSLVEPNWKERGIENIERAVEFLENYKWSSYLDYLGIKNFPSVTERMFLSPIMGGQKGCREAGLNWIKYKNEIRDSYLKYRDIFVE